ncbi:hypothetical protein CXG81DRAFT_16127 [Caulochytrium protostelioides]|uniref:Acyltransferase-domain-containing protein n=1 Tax=Caulochytrium protostelioides TaxID=1555241 RepID=A0A4P9WXS9_9FUNG|nr:acyltransferase-domain-containing protein [Caulochytrium protostelioides]RKO98289.1 hypothetical protein CXG81DRAFT_16127 [Caulochytrium protostelioides]|eukprot:RKO98289.1 hypothetical protein CXG81DRAFT_16127 [Caulochytrium protostelioides]
MLRLTGRRDWYRVWLRFTEAQFVSLMLITLQLVSPVTLHVSGDFDALRADRNAVLIANHQIYTDWCHLWALAWFRGGQGGLKIMLKDSLKLVPFYGSGMHFFEFIFLKRKWAQDKSTIRANLSQALVDAQGGPNGDRRKLPFWLLLFPEGTVITPDTYDRTLAYSAKMGLPPQAVPSYVLLPKSTGLFACLQSMAQEGGTEDLFDITMGYSGTTFADGCPYSQWPVDRVFFRGDGPRDVHIHIRRFPVAQIPGIFNTWLRSVFLDKDALMTRFYATGRFVTPESEKPAPPSDGDVQPVTRITVVPTAADVLRALVAFVTVGITVWIDWRIAASLWSMIF